MKRQVRLYIGGQEADLSEGDLILFNYTLEDLSNPTVVKNSYTQQVTLKGTPNNNDIFGHIWRLDRDQQFGGSAGPEFDPSRKTGFQLFDGTGNLLESGYVKLDNILRHGADIQYAVTLYGGLGSFLYGLSFDGDGNQKTLASLDYLGTGDPDRELDFTIDAGAVQSAWVRLLSNPTGVTDPWDVINFAPCYNGIPDRFAPGKGLIKPTEVGLPGSITVEGETYNTVNGWALLNMAKDMTEWEVKDLRSYLQRPVVSVRAVLAAIAKQSNNGGYVFDSSVLDGSNYDGMWMTLPLLPSIESYKNVSQTITLSVDGSTHNDSFNVPVSIGTSLQVGSKVDVSLNIGFGATVLGVTATPLYFGSTNYSGGIGTTERYDFSGFFAQLVAYDSLGQRLAGSKIVCVGSSDDYGQLAKDGKTRAEATGFTPQVDNDYTYVEAVLAGASGTYTLSTDINLSVSCYNAETYKIFITPYHFRKTIHFGELYRKTWRSHSLGMDAMRIYSGGTEYNYTAMRLFSGTAGSTASYKTPESVRSGAAVNKTMLLSTDYTPADFLLGIVKSLGLFLHYDGVAKKVTLMSKNNYFRPGVIDIEARVDRGRDIQIAPLAFDTKWLTMETEPIGGAFEGYYSDTYGQKYGTQRIGTGYDFNTESKDLMESVVFRSGVQACENSRYFNDVVASNQAVQSQLLDAGQTLAYRNAAGDSQTLDVPVVSSPTITYWGSQSFQDVEGYDFLTACKLQAHSADGKPVDGSGVLLFRTGVQRYEGFKISDDLTEMMTLNDGTPCWRMDIGQGVTVPVFTRYRTSSIYKQISSSEFSYEGEGVTTALDFGRVQELNAPHMAYFPGAENVTIYEKMWKAYLRDRYNVNTRVVTAWVNMSGIQVTGESLRKFYFFDGSVWSLNRVINYSVTTDDPVQCEFVKVQSDTAYLYGQDFGGSQVRGTIEVTVTPTTATVRVDGQAIALTGGAASVSVTAGQHVVEASAPGYATGTQVVNVREEETTTVSFTLVPGVEQLYITVEPATASSVIALTIDGVTTPYTAGMNVTDGATVGITVSASGYATQTRTFTMSPENANQFFSLVASQNATISQPSTISAAAQNVSFTVSDPSNHGWILDYDAYLDMYITGGGVTSGNATDHGNYISGTGNAVVYLSVMANTNPNERTIQDSYTFPFYFEDETSGARTGLVISQLGTSGSMVYVSSVSLSPTTLSMTVGEARNIVATVSPSNATNKSLVWESSNNNVATVSQAGRVIAVGAGTCQIYATSTDGSNKTGICNVTVAGQTVSVTGVSVNPTSLNLSVGASYRLAATVVPSNATNKSVTWSVRDDDIATVSGEGVVTGVSAGTTVVTVRTVDGNYTATCLVTVNNVGSLSAENVEMTGTATSASSKLTAVNMDESTLVATCDAAWVTNVEVDTSGTIFYVRIRTTQNMNTSPSRSTVVTVTGYDVGSAKRTTTFTLTQNVKSVYDVPCTVITIFGESTLQNSGNSAEYNAAYSPNGCTMTSCNWSIVSGSQYIEIVPSGNQCVVNVKPGAAGNMVTIKAKNAYNGVEGIKTIEVTYVTPSNISVNPSSIRVAANDISNNSPVITATGIETYSLHVKSVSGFIRTAEIANGKVYAYFSENTSSDSRNGSVTLAATDANTREEVTAVIGYVQVGQSTHSNGFYISGLSVNQVGEKVISMFRVYFRNTEATDYTFYNLYCTLAGYDADNQQTFIKSGNLGNKIVAAETVEDEVYEMGWILAQGRTTHYILTILTSIDSASYEGDGTDII